MPVDPELLEILACPNCKTPVTLVKNGTALKCDTCKRVYPIKDDIPVMLIDEALTPDSSPKDVWDEIRSRNEEAAILLAGHEPLFSATTAYLLAKTLVFCGFAILQAAIVTAKKPRAKTAWNGDGATAIAIYSLTWVEVR